MVRSSSAGGNPGVHLESSQGRPNWKVEWREYQGRVTWVLKKDLEVDRPEEVGGWAAKWMQVVPGRTNSVTKAPVSKRRWTAFLDPGSSMAGVQKWEVRVPDGRVSAHEKLSTGFGICLYPEHWAIEGFSVREWC